jgi:hypothetical protein
MKAVCAIVVLVLGVLVSCQTTEPIWFIATPGYVEAQIATREAALRRDYDVRIEALETELDDQRRITDELAGLSEVIREVEASNVELRELAARVEEEIADLPEETIRTIVDVLTRHLEDSE